jgi:hypothetical protein
MLPGRTQDISECGMSAILPVELREGQEVKLQIRLPSGTHTIRAIVCDIAMSFVMALSSWSHYTELSETKLSQAAADTLGPFDLSPAL